MSVFSSREVQLSPLWQMLLLLVLVMICGSLFTLAGAWLATQFFAISDLQTFASSMEEQAKHPGAMLMVQAIGALGAFYVPALVFSLMQNESPLGYYRLNMPVLGLLAGLAIMVLFFSQPVISAVGNWNEQLHLPDALGWLRDWLDETNASIQEGYDALLNINSVPKLIAMLLVVAILPAIGEELIFRGGFQQILHRWTKNGHAAVWLAAMIFSLFHFQFYYFVPRLLLGAAIGYLFMWSGNLWYAIIAHFFNNAWVVVIAYFYLQQGKTVQDLQETEVIPPVLLIGGSLLFIAVLLVFRHFALQRKRPPNDGEMG